MDKRKRIGLIYNYNEGWIGGTYYIENIIHALNVLPDCEKPLITVLTTKKNNFKQLKAKTNYPYIRYFCTDISFTILDRVINKLGRLLIRKNIISKLPPKNKFDWVFPNPHYYIYNHLDTAQKIFWIPDFQEEHLPHFFLKDEVYGRKKNQNKLSQSGTHIVFSSNDALADYNRLYPNNNTKTSVIPFAVTVKCTNKDKKIIGNVLEKYKIDKEFFIIPNQLWAHKNHLTVLKSISHFNKNHSNILFIFTGKEEDYRQPDFPNKLKQKVYELGIETNTKFLGFIPKEHLEVLIQKSLAIIQPSLFEGWNTSVEEAKSHNKFIIASDISIHLEQLSDYPNKLFFKKLNEEELARILIKFVESNISIVEYNYNKCIKEFGKSIINL